MTNFLSRAVLFIFVVANLFGLLLYPTIAQINNSLPPVKETVSVFEESPLISTQITFTPVVTIYLPIIFSSHSPDKEIEVDIELPNGLVYQVGDTVEVKVTVSSMQGVDSFTWTIFTQSLTAITGGYKECAGASQCIINEFYTMNGSGDFFVAVEAIDVEGKIKTKTLDFIVE